MRSPFDQLTNSHIDHSLEIQQKARFLFSILVTALVLGLILQGFDLLSGSHIRWHQPYLNLSWTLLFAVTPLLLLKGIYRPTVILLVIWAFLNLLIWFSLSSPSPGFIWKLSLLLQIPLITLAIFGFQLRQIIFGSITSLCILGWACLSETNNDLYTLVFLPPALAFHLGFSLFWIFLFNLQQQLFLKLEANNQKFQTEISELSGANRKLQKVLNSNDIFLWELSPEEKVVHLSGGCSSIEHLSKTGLDFELKVLEPLLPDRDRQQITQRINDAMAGKSDVVEFEHQININGTKKWLSHKAEVLKPVGEGTSKSLLGMTQDITQRKTAEAKLEKSRKTHQLLFNNDLIGLYQISFDQNRILEGNQFIAELFGYQSRESFLASARLEDLLVDSAIIDQNKEILNSQNQISNFDAQFQRQDKSRFWGRYSLKICAKNRYVEGVLTDITGLKQAETQLDESEQRFQDLVENALMGISIVKGTQFIYMNPEQKRIFSPNTNLKNLDDLEVYSEDQKKFQQICRAIKERQPIQKDIEISFYPSEEHILRKELRYVVLRTDQLVFQGQPMTLLNMTDITHVKRMEYLALLRSKMSSLGHISVGIAHEIRSPLTGINLLVDGLHSQFNHQDSDKEIQEVLGQIQKAVQKVEMVVKRVLDFAKPSEPRVKAGNINLPIQNAMKLSETLLRKTGVTHHLLLSDRLPNLYLDTHLMEQVFLNLIGNAVNAMQNQESDRVIRISTFQQGKDILIEISDSGPGISEHLHSKIFDPFFTTRSGGSGIGLSICQRIITDHGGVIYISTSDLKGTQLNIRLPIDKRQIKR